MITPVIIKIVFWIAVGGAVLVGLFSIGTGMVTYDGQGLVVSGILMIILGPLVVRIYCELIIIMFKVYESLNEIKDTLKKSTISLAEEPKRQAVGESTPQEYR